LLLIVATLARLIQGLILFSTILGVFFLWEVYPLLPSFVFDAIAFGWVLWVIDSALTFVRPKLSYYLGLLLAFLTLAATLSQPEHYSLVGSGNLEAAATLIAGSSAQIAIILAVSYLLFARKGGVST
jgi:hypothetical protein